jgi:hypothetical protein
MKTLYDFLFEFEMRLGFDFRLRESRAGFGVTSNLLGWSLMVGAAYLIAVGLYWYLIPLVVAACLLRPRLVRQYPGLEGRVHPWKLGVQPASTAEWEVERHGGDEDDGEDDADGWKAGVMS